MEKNTPPTRKPSRIETLALTAPEYLGSPFSLVLHTVFFAGIFILRIFGITLDQILLILTTIVSLEAIYLAIFIQITVNQHAKQIEEVSEDVEELGEDVEEISKDIDTIQEDVKEISEDIEDISEDVEELGEEIEQDDHEDAVERTEDQKRIDRIESAIEALLREVHAIKEEK
jgi:uncharacterized protein YoxC